MTMAVEANVYRTSDLNVAAFLIALGHSLTSTARLDQRRVEFGFGAEARQDAARYFAGGSVPARAFATALRDLKAALVEGLL